MRARFLTSYAWFFAPALVVFFFGAQSSAVDGVSVTAHWTGSNENLYGGYGQIVRHDIVDSQVVGHSVLYDNPANPARNPVIAPDGSRVAFLLQDGSIAVMSIVGGQATILQSAQSHGEACLDWPAGDWIYYTKGGFSQPSGSKLLHRVNAVSDSDEYVLTFLKDDGVTESGTWRFHIANDLTRSSIRPDDTNPMPAGCITAFDLVNDGHLRSDRSLGSVGDYRCSTGIDPQGVYILEGNQAHDGVSILRWDDLSEVKSFLWTDTLSWGPDTADTGNSHNRNAWSTNSQKWLCIHIGFGTRGARGANQMLINWVDEERIVVSENQDDESPRKFDDAGDFWVGSASPQPPQITVQPQDLTVSVGELARFDVQATGSGPLGYQWQRDGGDVPGANAATYSFTADISDDGAGFRCLVSNSLGSATSNSAVLTVLGDTTPPVIQAVSAPGAPDSVWVTFSEPVAQSSAETAANYAIDHGIGINTATRQADPAVVLLSVTQLSGGTSYTLTVNNVTDQAQPPNAIAPNSTFGFSYADQNQAPVVEAGPDASVRVSEDLLLSGSASDDGLPSGSLSYLWTLTSGPGNAVFSAPSEASCYVRLDAVGDYVLRLMVDDGDKSAFDELAVSVTPQPSITIVSPAGGEEWQAGTTQTIQWTAIEVSNVSLDYSTDAGQNWRTISPSVDQQNDPGLWGHYSWNVPNDPSQQAIIQISVYSDPDNAVRSNPFTILGSGNPEIHLLSPSGGETMIGNSTFEITWNTLDAEAVVLEYSLDGGDNWQAIALVDSSQQAWFDYPWSVPNVSTELSRVRARSPGGGAEDSSDLFSIEPEAGPAGDLELTSLTIQGEIPPEARGTDSLTIGGKDFPVADDGSFEAEITVPGGAERFTFEIHADREQSSWSRVTDLKVAQTIPGLGVSAAELREFLGDKDGILAWVNAGGQIQVLDFRQADPQVQTLSNTADCVNPLISPDGTRIVYSQGRPNGPKSIHVLRLSDGESNQIATGDIGYWHFSNSGDEFIVYCDWSDKNDNGAGGKTYSIQLAAGDIAPAGSANEILDRAMDAGPDADLVWLGQVYGNLWAHNQTSGADYPTDKFFLEGGSVADHQTCNGSMAPDSSGRLMCLVIPHDFIRIFSYDMGSDTFKQTSEFRLPRGMTEWEFPEWSTSPGFFSAILRASDLQNRLFVGKTAEGDLVPELLEISGEQRGASNSHLWIEP
jgi:hypothetical protein